MKTKFYFLCVIVGLSALHSCTNEISEDSMTKKKIKLTQDEVFSISYDEAKDLDQQTLFDMVRAFANAQNDVTTRSSATSFKITKESFINKEGEFDEQEQATRAINNDITSRICEIEFKNGSSQGRAIVSANPNFPSIIAFIPKCSNDIMMERTGASQLLHASKASYLYKTIIMKHLADSLKLPTLKKISKELNLPIDKISFEKIKDYITITDKTTSTRSKAIQLGDIEMQVLHGQSIFPLVKTNWGQDYPYNELFRNIDIDGLMDWVRTENGGKNYTAVPAGCVNIAMAQMMTYTHCGINPPTAFPIPKGKYDTTNMTFNPDWCKMSKTPKLDDKNAGAVLDAQRVILDLYIENKTKSKKDFDGAVIASEVTYDNLHKTMKKYFSFEDLRAFNGDIVWAALRNKNLVLMFTSDHVFIISGILVTEKSIKTRQLVKQNDVYWHANLGWADECTGYYQLDGNANTYFDANAVKEWCYKMDFLNNIHAKKK